MASTIDNLLSGADDEAMLDGLGRKRNVNFNPEQKKAAIAFANLKTKKTFQHSLLTPGQKYFYTVKDQLDPKTREDLKKGNVRLIERKHYLRVQISGGKNEELVQGSEVELTGVRSLQNGKLSTVFPTVVTALRLAYAIDTAAGTEPGTQQYTNAKDAETGGAAPVTIPASFLNAEVEFSQDGKPFWRGPVAMFFRDSLSVSGKVEGEDDVVKIKPQLIKQGIPVQVEIRYAKTIAGAAIPLTAGVTHFVEVMWIGDTVSDK